MPRIVATWLKHRYSIRKYRVSMAKGFPDLAYVVTYARSTAHCDNMSVYIVLYSILYDHNVHVYSQIRMFLSYGQCPVPRCPDKGSLSVFE